MFEPDLSPFLAFRQFGGYIPTEIKVLVPFAHVLRAEEVLRDLELSG
jgi:hypothetical protein